MVCLTEGPSTGYELAKTFDTSIGFFWRADHQQIYRELAKLRAAGHVETHEVIQSGKPNKLVYSLNEKGRQALRAWSSRGNAVPTFKDDLLVKLYALEHVDIDAIREQLTLRVEHHRDRLRRYQRIVEKRFAGNRHSVADTGKLLGLKLGLRYERGWVEWCEDALTALVSIPASAEVSLPTAASTQLA
jgi:DNA-binding PadR family transcriptional regulator